MKKDAEIFFQHYDAWTDKYKSMPGVVVEYPTDSFLMKIRANFSDFWNKVPDS